MIFSSSSAPSSVDIEYEEDNTDLLHGSVKTFSATSSLVALKEKMKETTNDEIIVLRNMVRALQEENPRLNYDLYFCRGAVSLILINSLIVLWYTEFRAIKSWINDHQKCPGIYGQ